MKEPLITEADELFRQLLEKAKQDTVPFAEKLSLAGRLTGYLAVKHRIDDASDGKGGVFEQWRTQRGGAGGDRPGKPGPGGARNRRPRNPANADIDRIAATGGGAPDHGETVPDGGDDALSSHYPGDQAAAPPLLDRVNGSSGDGDAES